jgi:hypothetical protein
MGYFSNLSVDIIEAYEDGMDITLIATKMGVSPEEVRDIIEAYEDGNYDADPGEMDGDFDSAMASAGFGTDEDYGYYGDE